MNINEKELQVIASMHISPSIADLNLRSPITHYNFFLDKIKLFYNFDKKSIILKKNDKDQIIGILIYTHNESEFNTFSGPKHLHFYIRILKTLCGFYGFRFNKFITAARSMLGKNINSEIPQINNYGKIWVLLVMKEYRRKGVAIDLLNSCINAMQKDKTEALRVTVKTDNQVAINAYEKSNFEIIGKCIESSGESYIMQIKV